MLFIYNPYAGRTQIRNNLLEIIETFAKADYEVTVIPTQKKLDAKEIVYKCANSYDLVTCAGGDGTLDEVVSGMMLLQTKVPLGYIPAGTTNDFANSLHIPKQMKRAAVTAVHGKKFLCDIGTFNADFFVYIAAFGIFTDVSYETRQDLKNLLGHMAYILEGMKRLMVVPSYRMKFSYKDLENKGEMTAIEGEFIYGMITNSQSVGGFKRITGKNVLLDDGLFEVTLIRHPKNATELNRILLALSGKKIDTESMYCFKTNHIEVKSAIKVAWTLDGEFGGMQKKVTITNLKQALSINVLK